MSNYMRLKSWSANQTDLTIGAVYLIVEKQNSVYDKFYDDNGDPRSTEFGTWEAVEYLTIDQMSCGEDYILLRWEGLNCDISIGKEYKTAIDDLDGEMIFLDNKGQPRSIDLGIWTHGKGTEKMQEKIQTPAEERGIVHGKQLRCISDSHHDLKMYDLLTLEQDDGTTSPFFTMSNGNTTCAWITDVEPLTEVKLHELKIGKEYVLMGDWSGYQDDLTVGKEYKIQETEHGTKFIIDDAGDRRGASLGKWSKIDTINYDAEDDDMEEEDALDMFVVTHSGIGLNPMSLSEILGSVESVIPKMEDNEPNVNGIKMGDRFSYNAAHGMLNRYPMSEWKDGDPLEVIAIKYRNGSKMAVLWNERHESASTCAESTLKPVDSRVETLMEEVGLTREQAVESLRVLDHGE